MISDSHVAYGSFTPRQGRERALARYHGFRAARKAFAEKSMTAAVLALDGRFVFAFTRAGFVCLEGFCSLGTWLSGCFFGAATVFPRFRGVGSGRRLCGVDLGIYQQFSRMLA